MLPSTSNLPSVKSFKQEAFQGSPEWFRQFLVQLNLFTEAVYSILNGGVGATNLIFPKTYSQQITAASPTSFNFRNPLNINVSSVIIGNVWSGIPANHPTAACQVMWHESQGTIYVDDVIGLTPGSIYNITLVVM